MNANTLEQPRVVSREEWRAARRQLLQREKAITHQLDEVAAERRRLPWVKIDKPYRFEGPDGVKSLADLFGGSSQLIVYHFMFAPGWEEGCHGCSFVADHIDGANLHLAHHDVTLLAVSRAPWAQIAPFKKRMGWRFDWLSSAGSDFNRDFGVQFSAEEIASGRALYNGEARSDIGEDMPGLSVFYRNPEGEIFHTYSTYARGLDLLLGAHNYLDFTPKGRNERSTMDWVRLHDRYEGAAATESCCAGAAQPGQAGGKSAAAKRNVIVQ
ncbi:DUF899 domain-containing protein [Pseudomonas indica]|uniref:Predicted dithiol-disulfide oxidoreductase, DUF899 family n=1 Tax=Pseudomonas indica TaxID=137658 RepID=A0A1G9JUU4_9PSED|nr:thioredoxin family protein [Pseudomonas indica]SDL40914.1 Predicted dithiol-disulfide oxidoreductase, DUF899 family [Pseudomonas indica]